MSNAVKSVNLRGTLISCGLGSEIYGNVAYRSSIQMLPFHVIMVRCWSRSDYDFPRSTEVTSKWAILCTL